MNSEPYGNIDSSMDTITHFQDHVRSGFSFNIDIGATLVLIMFELKHYDKPCIVKFSTKIRVQI